MDGTQPNRQARLLRGRAETRFIVSNTAEKGGAGMAMAADRRHRGLPLRAWLAALLATPQLACGGVETRAEPALESVIDCPATHELTLQSCAGPASVGYGSLPSKPLEWGATRAGALYFGRLVCPGGGLAMTERAQSGALLSLDGVEAWEVRCPGDQTPRIWYATPRKCGNPCPPDGLRVIPQSALQRYIASVEAFDAGDTKLALQRIDEAVVLAPPNELLTLWKGTMLEQSGRPLEAVAYYEAAVRMNPDEPSHKLFLARAQRTAGHEAPYRSAVDDLLAKLPSGHPLVPELQCLKAELLAKDGKSAEAQALATKACQNSHADCCPGK